MTLIGRFSRTVLNGILKTFAKSGHLIWKPSKTMLNNFIMMLVSLVTSLIVYVHHEPGDELVIALTWFICLVTFILAIVATCIGKDMFDL